MFLVNTTVHIKSIGLTAKAEKTFSLFDTSKEFFRYEIPSTINEKTSRAPFSGTRER